MTSHNAFSSPLVIVESPTKAKTLRKFLPKNFTIVACNGHVRDLPQSAKDIPEKLKKEAWAKIGVDVADDFKPLYVVPKEKSKIVSELSRLLKSADALYLATDEDREGESISWHLMELLKPKVPCMRMVFHEITRSAIERAIATPRTLDGQLVKAQETRRVLDRLVGYTLSPLLWNKIAFGLSAGRVQSAAVQILVRRERERMSFKSAQYCGILAKVRPNLSAQGGQATPFDARLTEWQSEKIATGKDFDETTGELIAGRKVKVLKPAEADAMIAGLKNRQFVITSVEEKQQKRHPAAPFITSTLQQEANRKLNLSARETMRTAQSLYERGFITYMRTDSTLLSGEAIQAARHCIESKYGRDYLPASPRQYQSKSANAQEAHEAIRPAGTSFATADELGLSGAEKALYDLIWKRTVASQMAEALEARTAVTLQAGEGVFAAHGLRIVFPGFLRAYVEGSDDPQSALDDRETLLPPLKQGEALQSTALTRTDHETKPPPRYTEAALVQKMEKEGIGRPSTYAATIGTIIDRGYVIKQSNALIPTFTAFAVNHLLERNFAELVDLKFTAQMEKSLDHIAEGRLEYLPYLKDFYLTEKGLQKQVEQAQKRIQIDEARTLEFGKDLGVEIKIGKFGPYFVSAAAGEEGVRGSIPEQFTPADLSAQLIENLVESSKNGPESLGKDPVTDQNVYLLTGRYGPYVQLGMPKLEEEAPAPEVVEVAEAPAGKVAKGRKKAAAKASAKPLVKKPKMVGLPKELAPSAVTLEIALKLLSLPRTLGVHPETGQEIKAGLGRFGPFIVHQGEFRSLKKSDDVLSVNLSRALEILAEPKGTRGRSAQTVVRDLGAPKEGAKSLQILSGRFGLYVTDGKTNVTLKDEAEVQTITLAEALERLQAKTKRGRTAAKKTR